MSKRKNFEKSRRTSMPPSGPYTTGCCDLMIGNTLEGTLLRLFYPTTYSSIQDHQAQWTKWFLGKHYSKGLARFYTSSLLLPFYEVVINKISKKNLIPAVWEAPVAEGFFPLVIFSHGLGAHRNHYTSICNDIASHGFIVAVLEHRDRSACATFTLNEEGKKEWVFVKDVTFKNQFDVRYSQVQTRSTECSRVLDVLEKLNRGEVQQSELPLSFQLNDFQGKIDVSNPIMIGHSFGGATVMLALAKDKRFKGGVCLDPWLFPLHGYDQSQHNLSDQELEEMKNLSDTIEQPLLFILMEKFQDEKNLQAMQKYQEKSRNKFWTLLKAVHLNQTDAGYMFRNEKRMMQDMIGSSSIINPEIALKLNNSLTINFICDILNIRTSFFEDYENYICKNSKWAVEGAFGSAKCMVGWHDKFIKMGK